MTSQETTSLNPLLLIVLFSSRITAEEIQKLGEKKNERKEFEREAESIKKMELENKSIKHMRKGSIIEKLIKHLRNY